MVHLRAISEKNLSQAKLNPNAQGRNWRFSEKSFSNDENENPQVSGNIRRQDCGQITDGAAVVFLATEERAKQYAKDRDTGFG